MELNNDFMVPVGIEEAWVILNDVERIAPCLPGAQLTEIAGEEFRGHVKVKVGPITTQYKGAAHFIEQNHAEKRVVIDGQGRDIRGAGNANAIITATLVENGPDSTTVSVNTDLKVTGKVAQFGRGVMADISSKLMGQFADNLAELIRNAPPAVTEELPVKDRITPSDLAGAVASAASSVQRTPASETAGSAGTSDGEPVVRKIDSKEADAVDLLDAAGNPLAKRAIPIAAGVAGLLLLRRLFSRLRA